MRSGKGVSDGYPIAYKIIILVESQAYLGLITWGQPLLLSGLPADFLLMGT
jgi:hypothetical protein